MKVIIKNNQISTIIKVITETVLECIKLNSMSLDFSIEPLAGTVELSKATIKGHKGYVVSVILFDDLRIFTYRITLENGKINEDFGSTLNSVFVRLARYGSKTLNVQETVHGLLNRSLDSIPSIKQSDDWNGNLVSESLENKTTIIMMSKLKNDKFEHTLSVTFKGDLIYSNMIMFNNHEEMVLIGKPYVDSVIPIINHCLRGYTSDSFFIDTDHKLSALNVNQSQF